MNKITTSSDGTTKYYQYIKKKGKFLLHRLDGPAIDSCTNLEWWFEGDKVECSTQEIFEKLIKLKIFW